MIMKLFENVLSSEAERGKIARPLRLRVTRIGKRAGEHLAALNSRDAGPAGGLERIEDEIVDTTVALRRLDRIRTNFPTFGKMWMPH